MVHCAKCCIPELPGKCELHLSFHVSLYLLEDQVILHQSEDRHPSKEWAVIVLISPRTGIPPKSGQLLFSWHGPHNGTGSRNTVVTFGSVGTGLTMALAVGTFGSVGTGLTTALAVVTFGSVGTGLTTALAVGTQ